MSKIYYCIALEGKQCVNGFVLRIIVAYFFALASREGTMGRPISDFHFSLLTTISKRESRTNDDDEWIMFQLCTDAVRYN